MQLSPTLSLLIILAQVVFLEAVLSLDNAAVLGTIVLGLPVEQAVPWPRGLKPLGRLLDPLLGKQRTAGLRVGLLGAYFGQALMLVMASFVIRNPWLQLIGAAYLLKISISTLGAPEEEPAEAGEEQDQLEEVKHNQRGFWATVIMVELMDLAFSLDNVVVVVSLSNQLWLVMVGVAIGILIMRFAAGIFSKLIEKIPPLATAAYVLVFNIGVEFILSRLVHLEIPDLTRFIINVGTLALAVVYARVPWLQRACKTPFKLFWYFFAGLNWVFNLVFFPIGWVWGKLASWVRKMFQRETVSIKAGD